MREENAESLEKYYWVKVDREMWDTGHVSDMDKLSQSIAAYEGLIVIKNSHGEAPRIILAEGYCSEGIPYGLWDFYHSTGKLAKRYNLLGPRNPDPDPEGKIEEWYLDGKILLKGCYSGKRANMTGRWYGGDALGETSLEEGKRFSDGVLGAVFFKDKNIDSVVFMDGSSYNQAPTECTEDGYRRYIILLPQCRKAYCEGYYKNGLRQGWWKLWMYDGRIIALTSYKDGLADGACLIINPWLFRNYSPNFREFGKKLGCCPYLVYFRNGKITTKAEYDKISHEISEEGED